MSKIYKNPHREENKIYEPYIPNYKKFNISPEVIKSAESNGTQQFLVSRGSMDNPRSRVNPSLKYVPFAEADTENKYTISGGPVPNNGNNIEHVWVGVDEQIIDDIGLSSEELSKEMIDNNDIIETSDENNYSSKNKEDKHELSENLNKAFELCLEQQSKVDVYNLGEYSLLLFGNFFASGSLEEIEDLVKSLVYNEHPLCESVSITLDDLVVLKKMSLKVGIFVEQ